MFISPTETKKLFDNNKITIIDVRTDIEYMTEHIPGSMHVPLHELKNRLDEIASKNDVVFLCRSGVRAQKAQTLCQKGTVIEGGINAWKEAALPTKRSLKTWELERQVRLVGGLIVIAGALLAATVSMWFVVIPLFIGAGFTYAALSNSCGMASCIARMPHNKKQR